MHLLALLLTVVVAGSGGPVRASWEKIYDGGQGPGLAPIHATGRDDWIAARGRAGLLMGRAGDVHVEDTHDQGVLGFFADAPGSLYALGEGELIWHFDGQAWTEEHIAPKPASGRGPFAAHMLYVGYVDPTQATKRLVAVGLELALVRETDGAWVQPATAERTRLGNVGLLGPAFAPPAGCARAAWQWLAPHRGAFTCHDGRLFTWDTGVVTGRGKLPRVCEESLVALADARSALYASCNFATIWKAEGGQWRRVGAPPEKGLTEVHSLSFADGCLFASGKQALWRACDL